MEKELKIAQEGGYVGIQISDSQWIGINVATKNEKIIALLDPLFWQALSKSLGLDTPITKKDIKSGMTQRRQWLILMHKFIDHIADNKDIESFFNNLIDNK